MSKRFESDRSGRHDALAWLAHLKAQGQKDATGPEEAVCEAKRILSETEREETMFVFWWERILDDLRAEAALAESLSAVLPVLDELAWGPVDATTDARGAVETFTALIHGRNRATLDAMGGR